MQKCRSNRQWFASTPTQTAASTHLNIDPALRLQASKHGRFRMSIQPVVDAIRLHDLHSWRIHIESVDGIPIRPKRILIGGGMPQHGHGFPSQPTINRYLGDGDWLLEGVQFNMTGQWQIRFKVLGTLPN